jgi:ATPase subunit of ABC transporter with duplicated ATPase domains
VARPYLKAQALSHSYGGELLFAGADVIVNPGDRIGVVGPNGAGKTTLLRILAGELKPAGGHLVRHGSTGWPGALPPGREGADALPAATAGSYLAAGLGEITGLAARMRTLETELATAGQAALAEYGEIQEAWTALRGWTAASRLAAVRSRLALSHLPDDLPLACVSGGELARLTLARMLLAEPDLLILDEPTNHLDAGGAEWLGGFLAGYGGGVIVASHDRAFLDRAVTQIIELDGIDPVPARYQGGYTSYREEKARRREHRVLEYEAQQKYRLRLEADIGAVKDQALQTELSTTNDRFRRYAKKVAKKAKARERRLERQVQSVRWLAEPRTRPPLVLALPPAITADPGDPVLSARGLSVSRGGKPVLTGVSLDLRPAGRVLVCGPNGAGKTTLLRALAGEVALQAGTVSCAHKPAVLPQRHDSLPARTSVLDFLRSRVPLYAADAEELLAAYQFGPQQWRAPLGTLSDGEMRRLLLAVLVNSGSPVLMLDEPTHYLDFDALDVIEEALRAYQGTLVMVTHDSYFAGRVGFGQRWLVGNGTVTVSPA